ncbi:MAG TPA: SAM-dependent methyltransferase, partial [Plasticicumulans sp.]|nr:SAM-dependent methyltransferase [Plasticicumulans sp.]
RAHDDALVWPGLQDLTAHVDFTAVADAALAAGFEVAGYCAQAWFLFGCGLEALLAEVDPEDLPRHVEAVRQVKLLTLPGEMGERFQAIGLTKGIGLRLPAFALRDERGRL